MVNQHQGRIAFVWVPGNKKIAGNVKADQLGRNRLDFTTSAKIKIEER